MSDFMTPKYISVEECRMEKKELLDELLNDLEFQYDYGSDEDFEKLIEKWEKRKNEV